MSPEALRRILARLDAHEAELKNYREGSRRRAARLARAGKLCPVLAVLGLATWALGQGVEIKTSDGAADQTRLKVETGAATVSAYFLNAVVGIGTNAPGARLHLAGDGTTAFLVDNGVTFKAKNSAGTLENYLWPRWTDNVTYLNFGAGGFNIRKNGTGATTPSTMFMQDDGDIGIGTIAPNRFAGSNTPAVTIETTGNGVTSSPALEFSRASAGIAAGSEIFAIRGMTGAAPAQTVAINAGITGASVDSGNLTFWTKLTGQAIAARMEILDNGYIGMGTLTPVKNLHLYQTVNSNTAIEIDTPGTQAAQQATINMHSSGDGTKALGVAGTTGWHLTVRGAAYPGESNDLGLYYWNGASWLDRMRWQNASGNVGISTSFPDAPLHVVNPTAGNRPTILMEANAATAMSPRLGLVDTQLGAVTAAPAWFIDNNNDSFRVFRQPNITTGGTSFFAIGNGGETYIYQGANLHFRGATTDAGDVIFETSAGVQKGRMWTEPAQNYLHLSVADNTPDFDVYDGGSTQVFGTTAGCVSGPGSWGPDNWLRLTTSVNGSTYHDLAVDNFYANGALRYDLAEVSPVDTADVLRPGELVAADSAAGDRMRKTRGAYEPAVLGIVTQPMTTCMTIGGGVDPSELDGRVDLRTIALAGRVPTIVNLENGAIRIGDPVASSSAPGAGMRAARRGSIVGRAMETFDGTEVNSRSVRAIIEELKRELIPPPPDDETPVRNFEPPEYARLRRAIAQLTEPLPPGTGRIIVFVAPGSYVPDAVESDFTRNDGSEDAGDCVAGDGDASAVRSELAALRGTVESQAREIAVLKEKSARLDALEARLASLEKPPTLAGGNQKPETRN